MAEEAADEVGRSTLFSKGALQIASGLLLAWPASALVQHAGCGALSAICSSGSRETRGTVAMMRLLQVCALIAYLSYLKHARLWELEHAKPAHQLPASDAPPSAKLAA